MDLAKIWISKMVYNFKIGQHVVILHILNEQIDTVNFISST